MPDTSRGSGGVVVGVDIGTTATKAVAYDADGRTRGSGSAGYPLHEPSPGAAVQDPTIHARLDELMSKPALLNHGAADLAHEASHGTSTGKWVTTALRPRIFAPYGRVAPESAVARITMAQRV